MTPTPKTRTLYESMSTEKLLELQEAFQLDRAAGADNATAVAFGDGRLALIAAILREREQGAEQLGAGK